MKITFKQFLMLSFVLGGAFSGIAQTAEQREQIIRHYDLAKLKALEIQLAERATAEKKEAVELAKVNGWPLTKIGRNGEYQELKKVIDGKPVYFTTYNEGSAITSRANKLHTNGGDGLNLNGQGMLVGIWDGSGIRISHQDITSSRATQKDAAYFSGNPTEGSNHATHVSGTMMGSGAGDSAAKGMAYQANLWANDWTNDVSEMTSEAALGLLLSNHSYGLIADNLPTYMFGAYTSESQTWDNITFNAPYYQPVVAAGNDRENSTELNPSAGGRDLLTEQAVSKNVIVVAAVGEVQDYTGPLSVVMSSFSNWGPTDDYRIKPDISDKGIGVYSTISTANNAYASMQGTSMASPGVTGSLLLLQQHYSNTNGVFMRSATLRGLMVNTAMEAGSPASPGPDYKFGWGLINVEAGASLITGTTTNSALILETNLAQGQTFTKTVTSDGVNPLKVTIAWTDPAGVNLNTGTNNSHTSVLVNDLDVRVTKGSETNLPWRLTTPSVGAPVAERGDNKADNIEKIEIPAASGEYVITVTHKGNLENGSQDYSLIASGIQANLGVEDEASAKVTMWPNPADSILNVSLGNNSAENFNVVIYDIQGRAVITKTNVKNELQNQIDISGIAPGIYMAEFQMGDTKLNKKLIKR